MSRRSRRSWGKRALAHEARARIEKVAELASAGYEPKTISVAAKLPQSLVEELLARSREGEGALLD